MIIFHQNILFQIITKFSLYFILKILNNYVFMNYIIIYIKESIYYMNDIKTMKIIVKSVVMKTSVKNSFSQC